jgi:hypothetical protein
MSQPNPPSCLAEFGRALWVATCAERELTDVQRELLLLACKQSDRAAEARTILTSEKIVGLDRFEQEKIHPAVTIERQASETCANLLTKILGEKTTTEPVDEDAEFFG